MSMKYTHKPHEDNSINTGILRNSTVLSTDKKLNQNSRLKKAKISPDIKKD